MTTALRAPHQQDHRRSVERKAEQGKMPQTLSGLLRWYVGAFDAETPERLHKGEVWRDRVSTAEMGEGVQPTGGSHLGSPALADRFRRVTEGSESQIDEDGYYLFPVRAALSRLKRRRPLTVAILSRVAMCEGDWRAVADAIEYDHEVMELFLERALANLWRTTYDRTLV